MGKIKLGLVVSRFNYEITSRMAAEAERYAVERGEATVAKTVEVPGAYEIPLAADKLLSKKNIDAVVALGAVIKGETKHDEVIMFSVCKQLLEISLRHKKPVGLGICGPGATVEQAEARIEEYARRAVESAIHMEKL